MEAKKLCPPESFSVVISSYCELEDGPIIKGEDFMGFKKIAKLQGFLPTTTGA